MVKMDVKQEVLFLQNKLFRTDTLNSGKKALPYLLFQNCLLNIESDDFGEFIASKKASLATCQR